MKPARHRPGPRPALASLPAGHPPRIVLFSASEAARREAEDERRRLRERPLLVWAPGRGG